MAPEWYLEPGRLTELTGPQLAMVRRLGNHPVALCRVVQGLIIPPPDATEAHLTEVGLRQRNLRPVSALLDELLELDDLPLAAARPADRRVVGTCQHVAVLSCALLRANRIPARARCGFATYFEPGKSVDHWIAEHWSDVERRWVRIDPEVLGLEVVTCAHDLGEGDFLTGGEAWQLCRKGWRDPMTFGVAGTDHAWGIAEIRGSALRDLAALNKVEMLPWDEWGPMKASYEGNTGPDLDEQLDVVAEVCASDDLERIQALYGGLRVPGELIS